MTDEDMREVLAENKRLEKLVYVPGLWRCPKCEFQLVQANLNAHNGTVTARDEPGNKCPNCRGPLWRVTERDAGNRLIDDMERLTLENAELRRVAAQVRAETVEEAAKVARKHANIGGDCDARGVMDWETGEIPCDMERHHEICLCGELNQHADKIAAVIRALLNKDGAA